jgi:predicted dehydrogenase
MKTAKNISRRKFIKSSTSVGIGLAIIPNLISASPLNKLNLAVIGVGGRGNANWKACQLENIVAMCDVDDRAAARGYNANPKAQRFKDYRKMFDKMANEIDAVIISTPDHTHFAPAMIAMQLGKHVYIDKPLAHNIWQVRTLKKAAAYYNVISQMGNQGHATDAIRRIKEWYEAGVIGEVKEVLAWTKSRIYEHWEEDGKFFIKPESYPPPKDPIPEELDWNLWLGPASFKPYNKIYSKKAWRGFYDFGTGLLGDWACHTLDAPFWSLDLGVPTTVESVFRADSPKGFMPDQSIIRFQFSGRGSKPPVILTWYEGGLKPENRPEWKIPQLADRGMIMVGDRQNIITGARPNDARLMMEEKEWERWVANEMPDPTIPRVNGGPQQEFLDAIKGNIPIPGSNFNYSAELTEMVLVGVLSQRFNKKIEYDAENMKVTNHPELEKYIKEPVRPGWEFEENLWK